VPFHGGRAHPRFRQKVAIGWPVARQVTGAGHCVQLLCSYTSEETCVREQDRAGRESADAYEGPRIVVTELVKDSVLQAGPLGTVPGVAPETQSRHSFMATA
jgi:hypothetical protein